MAPTGTSSAPLSNAEDAYRRLRGLLAAGRFQPGERLRETHLSTQLGVSRTPVREALRRLQSDGLVIAGGRGTTVAALTNSQVQSMYRFRASLESLGAELAASRSADGDLPPSALAALGRLRGAVEDAGDGNDRHAVTSANLALHRYIAELSANEFVIDALSRVWDRIAIATLTNVADEEWSATIHQHHSDLVAAIVRGDPPGAAVVARQHVEQAANVYRSSTADDGG